MDAVKQGALLRVGGIQWPVVVVSNDFFNTSGKVVVCPILEDAVEGPLHIRMTDAPVEGFILCEQVRFVDLKARRFSRIGDLNYYTLMDVSDAVMGMFDYQ
ncbi:MAG: type II toxin-antitoxin system PemK/MazF family toxin [Clostridia bacterium]|nr:type II toxin-antitoxin system PemK/MazF family toxin [Clostridia bacterium]